MQQFTERTKAAADSTRKKIRVCLPALLWIAGLLLAGSDGPWMPYINCIGGLFFFIATVWLGRVLPEIDPEFRPNPLTNESVNTSHIGHRPSCLGGPAPHRIKARFARDIGVI